MKAGIIRECLVVRSCGFVRLIPYLPQIFSHETGHGQRLVFAAGVLALVLNFFLTLNFVFS